MELIIKADWNKEQKEDHIQTFISLLGIELYKKCMKSDSISPYLKEKISINLCGAYIHSLVKSYIYKIHCGCIEFNIGEHTVVKFKKFVQERCVTNESASVGA